MEVFLEVKDLRHVYRGRRQETTALQGLSFKIKEASLVAILGPNGSGKSTFFKILSTQSHVQEGQINYQKLNLESDRKKYREQLGITFQSPSLDPWLSVEENLKIEASLYGMNSKLAREKIAFYLEKFSLKDRSAQLVRELSGGLARRVELAKTLLHEPSLILLDEPTNGLDPQARRDFWNLILQEVKSKNRLIVVATHLMEEAELCDQVIIMSEGRAVVQGSPKELKDNYQKDILTITLKSSEACRHFQEKVKTHLLSGEDIKKIDDLSFRLELNKNSTLLRKIHDEYREELAGLEWGPATMSDIYFHYTGKNL